MADDQPPLPAPSLLATGGGNATAAGVSFQAAVGATFATRLLTDRKLDERLRLGEAQIRSLRFETEAALDDILVETDVAGWVFAQVKTSLSLSESLDSEFGKTVIQIVRQWVACSTGDGKRGWDRSLIRGRDRLLMVVGPQASGTIAADLASALAAVQAHSFAPLPQYQQQPLDKLRSLLERAWHQISGTAPTTQEIDAILQFVSVLQLDLDGADRTAAVEILAHITETPSDAPTVFSAIEQQCERLMASRLGTDAAELRTALAGVGARLRAAPRYQRDVERLRRYSARVQDHLTQYEETKVGDVTIKIDRDCTRAAVDAAKTDPLVLVGEPGAGKSAVVSAAAEQLRADGHEVIELAVDRLLVGSLNGLKDVLGLDNSLRQVLENWPGSEPAFLFIDALDATRGGLSEAVFRGLIAEILDMPDNRWRVVASIRSFDLRLGEQFKNLFAGTPPSAQYFDPAFSNVRHVHVPRWSDAELAQVLATAPTIATAIVRAGDKLRNLARVPFNTRLLADLITGGLPAEAFGQVSHQVQLLKLYWQYRVEQHGIGAELCLKKAVEQMVAARGLQANRLEVAREDPTAYDNLRRSNVLITVSNDRYVSFRHHILFDYAASRVFINPAEVTATADLLRRDRGLGLMLAPALGYALQDLWVDGQNGRSHFWQAVIQFAGDVGSDPIARSVAARSACELPQTAADMQGLVALIAQDQSARALAVRAFSHVVGALTVRLEDGLAAPLSPWCYLANEVSNYIAELAWPLRTLLYLLVGRISTPDEFQLAGQAARRLFQFALGQNDQSSQLASAAIGFVGDTYASDPAASRDALRQLLTPERMRDHAHEDMPWLARKVREIASSDSSFVPEIYKSIFGHGVTDDSATRIGGGSQILPLSSNRRQDYEMARWTLKEAFPRFLREHPVEAVHALISALEGNVVANHPLSAKAEEITVQAGSRQSKLIDDGSHIWAWNQNDRHADNAASLVQAFSARLKEAPDEEALQLIGEVIAKNRLAILWSRMFRAGVDRPTTLGGSLWPFAIQRAFLLSPDTIKDAIDLIAARYPNEPADTREMFEREILAVEADPSSRDPQGAQQRFRQRIFGTIGSDSLVTPEAQAVVQKTPPAARENANPRLFEITSMHGDFDTHWWLRDEGVDVEAPANAALLAETEAAIAQLALNRAEDVQGELITTAAQVQALWQTAVDSDAAPKVIAYAKDTAARGCAKLANTTNVLREQAGLLDSVCAIADSLLDAPTPEPTGKDEPEDESSLISMRGVRVEAAEAVMSLCKVDTVTAARFKTRIERLAIDQNPGVRLAVASRLTMLWDTARDIMWELSALFGKSEQNSGVLRFFADFLARVLHVDPACVEDLTAQVLARGLDRGKKADEEILQAIGSITAILWVTHARDRSHALLGEWLANPAAYDAQLSHALHSIRDGLVTGYGSDDAKDAVIRQRCQQFAARLVEVTAAGMQQWFDQSPDERTEAANETVQKLAKLLDEMGDQFFFASGAFRNQQAGDKEPLDEDALKKKFLDDNHATFHRIGDVGTPHTIFHLIEMLGYLIPGDPTRVFDLTAHALLTAGRSQGFQFESLGADRFVEVIGLFLADHREVFENTARRDQLVACLEAFVDAGWPAARRLLYRLPELLQ